MHIGGSVAGPVARAGRRTIPATRPRRVTVLLLGIIVLSLADLLLTLNYLRTTGMMEANPLAAWVIRTTGSSLAITVFKALSVGVCVTLLYRLRRHLEGEIGAWCGVAILIVLTFMWGSYAEQVDDPEIRRLAGSGLMGDQWLVLE